MSATLTPPTISPVTESKGAPEAHIQRILRSPLFARAETQRRLLEYLWLHRHENLSEYALATEALGRSPSFDSTVDASVRVHISRLRRKLKDYYLQEPTEPEMILLPTGTHQLLVVDNLAPLPQEVLEPSVPEVNYRRRMWLMAALVLVFALTSAGLTLAYFLNTRSGKDAPQITAFWKTFLQGNAPIRIVLPTPTFFKFSGNPNMRFRSTNVNEFEEIQKDPSFAALTRSLGYPRLEQSYTVTWDTFAAIDMARYLDTTGNNRQRISFQVMRDSSRMLEQANVIALGTHQTLQPLHHYLDQMNFSLSSEEKEVINRHPEDAEPAIFNMVQKSSERTVRPSIVAVLPGQGPGLKVLILESRDTRAVVEMLSSPEGSKLIETMLHKHGDPKFYEMVVQTESESGQSLRSWPVALHAVTANSIT